MIYLDNIIFSLQKSGGISSVWYEHIKRLLRDGRQTKFIEYASAQSNLFRGEIEIPNEQIEAKSDKYLSFKRYFNPDITEYNPFIFHSSYYRTSSSKNAVNITTVHDFTYEYFSHGLVRNIHCWQKYKAIRNSDFIICISENTKNDLLKFLPDIDESRIRIVFNGVSEDYYPIIPNKISCQLPFENNSFILFVGAREGYKNFKLAVESIALTNLNLVIVGSPLSGQEERFLNNKLGKRYIYIGRITNLHLNELYNNAYCLLYPSAYEGFGIPVIEAQKSGCPVIAANSSSIPEIVGDKSLLIRNFSTRELYQKITMLHNHSFRSEVVGLGLENSKRFSWENTYEKTIKVYQEGLDIQR